MTLRVLEIGGLAAGFCGRLFQHAGADVVRVDIPALDSWVSEEAIDIFLHQGKRRVAGEATSLVRDLAAAADVVVIEGAPALIDQLGWHDLPTDVRVAITPFGLTGPLKDWQATASTLLAMGGYTYIMGDPDRPPLTLPGHYVQYQAGQHAYIAANALLLEGDTHQSADVSMWETVLSLSQFTTVLWTSRGEIRKRHGSDFGLLYPINLFPCADGWFHVNVVPTFWSAFTKMLDLPELELDSRFFEPALRRENKAALDDIIIEQLSNCTCEEIMQRGEASRVPTGILQSLPEVLDDPHLADRGFLIDRNGIRVPDVAYRDMSV